jgi:hypothetical protein
MALSHRGKSSSFGQILDLGEVVDRPVFAIPTEYLAHRIKRPWLPGMGKCEKIRIVFQIFLGESDRRRHCEPVCASAH